MEIRFSEDFFTVLEFSRNEALRTGWHNILPDHIMLAVLRHRDNPAYSVLETCGVSPDELKAKLDEALFAEEQIPWSERESINFCESAISILQHASVETMRCHALELDSLHFLLAVSRTPGSYTHDYLESHGIVLKALVEGSGMEWKDYGLMQAGAAPGNLAPDGQEESGISSGLSALAAAFEDRLREGYTTDNPLVS